MAAKTKKHRNLANPERAKFFLELRSSNAAVPYADSRNRRAQSRSANKQRAISFGY